MAPDLRLIISYVMKTHAAQPSASVSRAVAINITSARQPRCHCRRLVASSSLNIYNNTKQTQTKFGQPGTGIAISSMIWGRRKKIQASIEEQLVNS